MTTRRNLLDTAIVTANALFASVGGAQAQTVLKAADVHPAGYPTWWRSRTWARS